MAGRNDLTSDDKFETLSADIARISRSVSLGQKKEKYTAWGIIGTLITALGGGGYYVASPPKIASQSDIRTVIKQSPALIRPDPWTRSDDREARDKLRSEFILDHNRVAAEHKSMWKSIHAIEYRLNQGGRSREHDRINGLERRLELVEDK